MSDQPPVTIREPKKLPPISNSMLEEAKAHSLHRPGSVDSLNDQPWPLRDVVRKLCEAAEILLHEKNYDGHEEISRALKVGREWAGPPNAGTQRPGTQCAEPATRTPMPGSLE